MRLAKVKNPKLKKKRPQIFANHLTNNSGSIILEFENIAPPPSPNSLNIFFPKFIDHVRGEPISGPLDRTTITPRLLARSSLKFVRELLPSLTTVL